MSANTDQLWWHAFEQHTSDRLLHSRSPVPSFCYCPLWCVNGKPLKDLFHGFPFSFIDPERGEAFLSFVALIKRDWIFFHSVTSDLLVKHTAMWVRGVRKASVPGDHYSNPYALWSYQISFQKLPRFRKKSVTEKSVSYAFTSVSCLQWIKSYLIVDHTCDVITPRFATSSTLPLLVRRCWFVQNIRFHIPFRNLSSHWVAYSS